LASSGRCTDDLNEKENEMSDPLNPLLYRRLKEAFRVVRVSNDRVPVMVHYAPDWVYRKGRLRAKVVEWGETYHVNCPFCTDTRGRLYISHQWSEEDERTSDDMLHLAMCHNEGCLATRDAQKELHAIVYPKGQYGRTTKIRLKPRKTVTGPPAPLKFVLPEGTPLSVLPTGHPAIKYLRRRDFDPTWLAKRWGVYYCEANPKCYKQEYDTAPHFYSGRIVYPVYAPSSLTRNQAEPAKQGFRLAGWQARALEEEPADGSPKYLIASGMHKNELLYGLPEAIKTGGPVVIVEGVTDVWRLGTNALGLFGKTISDRQVKLLLRHLESRPVVVLLDEDAAENARRVREKIRSSRLLAGDEAPVVLAKLPRGRKDPGECTYAQIWRTIKRSLT
jgi:hypothetical protein